MLTSIVAVDCTTGLLVALKSFLLWRAVFFLNYSMSGKAAMLEVSEF